MPNAASRGVRAITVSMFGPWERCCMKLKRTPRKPSCARAFSKSRLQAFAAAKLILMPTTSASALTRKRTGESLNR